MMPPEYEREIEKMLDSEYQYLREIERANDAEEDEESPTVGERG